MFAVLALLLGSGTAISLTGTPATTPPPAGPPVIAALGDAPATGTAQADDGAGRAAASPSASPDAAREAADRPADRSRQASPVESRPAPPPPPPPPPPAQDQRDDLTALEDEVTERTNAERAAAGCGPVTTDERLRTAARAHSQDMAVNDYFSHTSLDGRSPFDRMRDAGYPRPAGENIAYGYRTPADVMNGWMNSDGHRRNLLNCSHVSIGVGLAYNSSGRPYWTQVFGR